MAIDKALLGTLSEDEGKSIRRLVEKGIKLPPQPAVLEELNHLLTRGVSDVRVLGRSIADIVHPDDIVTGYRLQQQLLATGDEKAEGEARFLSSTVRIASSSLVIASAFSRPSGSTPDHACANVRHCARTDSCADRFSSVSAG